MRQNNRDQLGHMGNLLGILSLRSCLTQEQLDLNDLLAMIPSYTTVWLNAKTSLLISSPILGFFCVLGVKTQRVVKIAHLQPCGAPCTMRVHFLLTWEMYIMDLSAIDFREITFATLFVLSVLGVYRFVALKLWPDTITISNKLIDSYMSLRNQELKAEMRHNQRMIDLLEALNTSFLTIHTEITGVKKDTKEIMSNQKVIFADAMRKKEG